MVKRINGLVVIPVYNEAATLPEVIRGLLNVVHGENCLFIDDGSSDRTPEILRKERVRYLRHPINLGYRQTLRTGIHYARKGNYPYIAFFDGDGQHRPLDLRAVIEAFEEGEYDLIVGSRYKDLAVCRRSLRVCTTKFFSWLVSFFTRKIVTDCTSGLKLIRRDFFNLALSLPGEDMHAEFILGLTRQGARFQEVKIEVSPRQGGESFYHFWKALWYPVKTLFCMAVILLEESSKNEFPE